MSDYQPLTDDAGNPITAGPVPVRHEPLQHQQVPDDTSVRTHDDDVRAAAQALEKAWGTSWQSKLATVQKYVGNLPENVRNHLIFSEMEDGSFGGNNPELLQMLYEEAIGIRPSSSNVQVTFAGGQTASVDLNSEIKKLENFMRTNRSEYNRDEAAQARLRFLYELRDGKDVESYHRKYGKAFG